ncbi:MAG: tyrosine-protein phosphatase [Candidatus Riflebacteria bacterium]|nr:tyrosine-protein phosphatase [Candidatus Riflebacteria bacterium]
MGLYEKIEEVYNDFDGFLKDGLKITEEQQARLREIYLE